MKGKELKNKEYMVEFTHIKGHAINNKEYFVEFSRIMGNHTKIYNKMYKNDFFIFISKCNMVVKQKTKPKFEMVFYFKTENEGLNFIEYLKTDFARGCLAINKTNQHLDSGVLRYVPALDFTRSYTNEELYKMFNISEDEQAFIKEVIPPYYE